MKLNLSIAVFMLAVAGLSLVTERSGAGRDPRPWDAQVDWPKGQ